MKTLCLGVLTYKVEITIVLSAKGFMKILKLGQISSFISGIGWKDAARKHSTVDP